MFVRISDRSRSVPTNKLMAESWDDLSDDELRGRLIHRDLDAAHVDLLVANRDAFSAIKVIDRVLGCDP